MVLRAIGATSMIISGVILLVIGLICCVGGVKFLIIAMENKKKSDKIVKLVERRTRIEYNKVASLSPNDLHRYLSVVFGRCLIFASDSDVAEKDPKAHETLYGAALSMFLEYLGDETIEAIEYHYGKDYLIRWAKASYRALEYENVASGIIEKSQSQSAISGRIAAWQ